MKTSNNNFIMSTCQEYQVHIAAGCCQHCWLSPPLDQEHNRIQDDHQENDDLEVLVRDHKVGALRKTIPRNLQF
jgi:hypothetical protein